MTQHFQKFLKSGLWTFVAKSSSSALALLQSILIARLLPPSEFGLYLLAMSIIWGLSTFAQWGCGPASVAHLGGLSAISTDDPEKSRNVISKYIFSSITIIIALILACGILLIITPTDWIVPDLKFHLSTYERILILIFLLIHALHFYLPEALRGLGQIRWASVFTGPLPALPSCLGFLFLLLTGHKITLIQVFEILNLTWGLSLLILICLVFSLLSFKDFFNKINFPELKILFRQNASMAIFQIVTFFSVQADLWLVNFLSTPADVAIYGIAQKLLVLFTFSPLVLGVAMLPQIAELKNQGRLDELSALLRRSSVISFAAAIFILLCSLAFGPWLITRFFGPHYVNSLQPFYILAAAQIFAISFGPLGYYLMMTNHQKYLLKISSLTTFLGMGLAMLFQHLQIQTPLSVAGGMGLGLVAQSVFFYFRTKQTLKKFTLMAALPW